MSYVRRKKTSVDPQIFNCTCVPTGSVTLTDQFVALNSEGDRAVPAGLFIAKQGNNTRFLPRAVTTTALTASSSTTFAVSPALSVLFKADDVLYPVRPFAVLNLSGTAAANDTVTVTVNGISVVTTATGSNLTTLAGQIATSIINDPVVGSIVTAIASGTSVFVIGLNGLTLYSIAIADSSGNLTTAVANSATTLTAPNTAIGTVASVNTTTGVITLTGAAGVTLPVGARVGVRVNEVLGLNHSSWDFTDMNRQNVAYYASSGGVRKNILPYFDEDLERRLPNIIFATRF